MNTILAWGILYVVLALGMLFFALDELNWKWSIPLSLFWPLTIIGSILILVGDVVCIGFIYIRELWRKNIKL